jgi:hypothetical protein
VEATNDGGVNVKVGAGGGVGAGAGSGVGVTFLPPPTERERKKALGRGGAAAWRAERLLMRATGSPLRPRTCCCLAPLLGMTQVKTTPILARRLTQRGMRARATRRRQAASQKWLQLRETRL